MNRNPQENTGEHRRTGRVIALGLLVILLVAAALQPARATAEARTHGRSESAVEWVSSGNSSIEPGGSQGEISLHQLLQPANLFGLIASLGGALVLGSSLMILSRRRA